MSVYNGFATRQQETNYNRLVESLIFTLQARITLSAKEGPLSEEKFRQRILSLHEALSKMEAFKYSSPKISESCKELIQLLNPAPQPPSARRMSRSSTPIKIRSAKGLRRKSPLPLITKPGGLDPF